jgi:MFS family permease
MSSIDPTDPDPSAARASTPPDSIWHNADLLRVLAGETISDLGSQIGDLALPLAAALALQATPGQMAAISVAEYLPRIVVSPIAGVWIDRLRRKPVLIATNGVRGLLFLAVAMAAAFGWLRMELLYGVGLVMAALGVVFETALVAYLPTLVTPPLLVAANGARATSSAATDVVGPGVCGVLVQLLGTPVAVALDGVSFLASAIGIALVRRSEPAPPPRRQRLRTDIELRAGVHALASNPILRAFVATAFTANFFYRVIMATYVLYLTRELALPPTAVGLIFGLGGGTGVLLGSAVASSVARSFGLGRTLVAAHFLFGVLGIPLLLAVVWPAQAAPLVFASEFAQLSVNAVYMVNRASVEQAVTPPRLRGRVQASRTVAHALSGVAGLVLGGVLAEQVGVGAAISAGVTGGLFSFLWLCRSPILRLRDLPRIPEESHL